MRPETTNGRRPLLWALAACAAFALGYAAFRLYPGGLPSAERIPTSLQSSLWPQPQALSAFSLIDQHRQPFGLDRLRGRWSFVFFGYTACPDACPTTMRSLKRLAQKLAETPPHGAAVQFLFVSVDPQRDNAEQLGRYVAYFNKDFIGLTGSDVEIAALARQLHVMYERSEEAQGGYQISHTAAVMLIDPQARLVAAFSRPHDTDAVVSQFHAIQHRYGAQP
jgi:protein SCO1/2